MADLKISQLNSIVTVVPATDVLPVVQGGATYKVTPNQLLGAGGTATLASATITGALTVDTTTLVANAAGYTDRVGIGTATPASRLDVADSATPVIFSMTLTGAQRWQQIIDTTYGNWTLRDQSASPPFDALIVKAGTGNVNIVTGNVVMGTSGKGIDFSAVTGGTGTATANVLSDYEEGTFDPTAFGSTIAGVTTYTTRTGRYTKIGNLVSVQVYLKWSAITGGTGNLRFGGLPFTSSSDANVFGAVAFGYTDISLTASNVLVGYISSSQTNIEAQQYPVGGGSTTTVPIDPAGEVIYSLTYRV
jgi:hypothetical protein